MANIQSTQAFYSLTLASSTAPASAVVCNAIPSTKKAEQQIFEARGQRIYLHRIVENAAGEVEVNTVAEQDVFGIVRGVAAFRIPGTPTDQLVLSTDSGRVILLNYDHTRNTFKRIHQETFGKSGVRRTVPGQYLASDPRGRCVMLASVEKNKVVYIVNRNAQGEIVISSPHEANQWASLCFTIAALDTGWEHPVFAALEVDYQDAEADPTGDAYVRREKLLTYYTVDLGLNHVVKSWSDTVDYTANKLFGVPGGQDGPSGVLVCCEDRIYYRHDKAEPLCICIPRRKGPTEDPERKRIIVSGCLHLSRARHEFFFLLQTDDGDVFKLWMEMSEDAQGRATTQPAKIIMKYYDTFPVAREMLLIRKGYIYVAAENGSSRLFHVADLAEDLSFEPDNNFSSDDVPIDPTDSYTPTYFTPRALTFTSLTQSLPSRHPLLRSLVANLDASDSPQIYTLQGTSSASILRTSRHGLDIQEIVSSPLGNLNYDNLWSLKHRASDPFHSYLVLTSNFGDKTIVLSIGDEVETMEETPFLTTRATVVAALMGEDTLVQVHARGVHSILGSGAVNAWPTPSHRTIVAAAANSRQLLLGLSSAELAFFFIGEDGILNQLEEMPEMSGLVTAVAVAPTPRGQQQARFAVVGCDDCTIRVLSIELDSPLEARSVQALSAVPTSIEVTDMIHPASGSSVSYVHIGLASGLYLRAIIDAVTGELGEVRTKFLGARGTRVFPVETGDEEGNGAVIACSTRPWLGYNSPKGGQYTLTPLVTGMLEAARPFVSEHLRGVCAIQGQGLLIFGMEINQNGSVLSNREVSLRYTPRGMAVHQSPTEGGLGRVYVVQADGNTLGAAARKVLQGGDDEMQDEEVKEEALALQRHLGLPRKDGAWASCLQVIDPRGEGEVTATIEMDEGEAALTCVCVGFESKNWEVFLAIGTGVHSGANKGGGFVRVYRLEGGVLVELHKTEFDTPIYALHAFAGRLAVGSGPDLLLYDLGMKALLRKTRAPVVPNTITAITSSGARLICADVSESLTYAIYKPKHNRIIPFADDTVQRWTTGALGVVDYETSIGGDKFGNLWVLRVPEQASREADEEGVGGFIVNERGYLGGKPYRLDPRAHFFTQDIPMSVQRTSLVAGGADVLFWAGLQGTLGILVPFASREDLEFFSQLEGLLRQEDAPISGRDHLMYRGYYVPVKGVVDGDLCERFMGLTTDVKNKVAGEMDRTLGEVERKVGEMRGRVAF